MVGGSVERIMLIDGDRGSLGTIGACARAYVEPALRAKYELDEGIAAVAGLLRVGRYRSAARVGGVPPLARVGAGAAAGAGAPPVGAWTRRHLCVVT